MCVSIVVYSLYFTYRRFLSIISKRPIARSPFSGTRGAEKKERASEEKAKVVEKSSSVIYRSGMGSDECRLKFRYKLIEEGKGWRGVMGWKMKFL